MADAGAVNLNTYITLGGGTYPGDRNNEIRQINVARVKSNNTEFIFKSDEYCEGDYISVSGNIYRVTKVEETTYGRFINAVALHYVHDPPGINETPELCKPGAVSAALNLSGDLRIGAAEYGGDAVIDSATLDYHTFICGKTGSGKTTSAKRLLVEMWNNTDKLVVIIDTHNEYAEFLKAVGIPYTIFTDGMEFLEYYTTDTIISLLCNLQTQVLETLETADNYYDIRRQMISTRKELIRRNTDDFRPKWLIFNTSGMDIDIKRNTVSAAITLLMSLRQANYTPPMLMLIDEAHNYAPQGEKAASKRPLLTLAAEGRKFGLGGIFITQRPARLDKSIISQCSVSLVHKLTSPNDLSQAASNVPGMAKGSKEALPYLQTGQCFLSVPSLQAPIKVMVLKP